MDRSTWLEITMLIIRTGAFRLENKVIQRPQLRSKGKYPRSFPFLN